MAQIRRSLLLPLSVFLLTPSFSKSVELRNPTHSHENQTQETRGGNDAASISFQWMSPRRDRALLEKVRTAFAGELKPDAKGDASPDAIHYRYLGRVGVSGNMALVVIGNRSDPKVAAFDFFDVYSLDLGTATKKKIVSTSPFYLLRYKSLAHFESGKAPDVIFEYQNCVECESATLLASFGIVNDVWSLRTWTGNDTSLGLGGMQDPEGDEAEVVEHAYRVGDFEKNGKDQIAVWVRTRRVATDDSGTTHSESNSAVIYYLENGILQKEAILDASQTGKLHRWICVTDFKAPLCRSGL